MKQLVVMVGALVTVAVSCGGITRQEGHAAGEDSGMPPPTSRSTGSSSGTGSSSDAGTSCGTGSSSGSEVICDFLAPNLGGPGSCTLPTGVLARWIAFDSNGASDDRDIYLVHPDGSGLLRLVTEATTEKEPAISNDGKLLAFASDRSGSMQIHLMDLGTQAVAQLTSIPGGADQPSWSSDDRTIVFHSRASVWIMASDGTGQRVVGSGPDVFMPYEHPSLTADGKSVVFDGFNEVDTMSLDGSGFRNVVSNSGWTLETPSLSPDGVNVAFSAFGEGRNIYLAPFAALTSIVTAETITPPLAGVAAIARKPAWGPGNVIAFELAVAEWPTHLNPTTIALSASPGSTPCEVVGGSGDNRNPTWAPSAFVPPAFASAAATFAADGGAANDAAEPADGGAASCPVSLDAFCSQPGVTCLRTVVEAEAAGVVGPAGVGPTAGLASPSICGTGQTLTFVSNDSETVFYYDKHQWLVGVVTLMGGKGEGGIRVGCAIGVTPLPDGGC